MHHLNAMARRALTAFRPIAGWTDAEQARFEYELTTLPRRGTRLALGGSLVFTGAYVAFNRDLVAGLARTPVAAAAEFAVYLLVFGVIGVFVYHTVRQLRTVSHIHQGARQVNLFQLRPAYAFSRLTARTGTGLLAMNAVLDPHRSVDVREIRLARAHDLGLGGRGGMLPWYRCRACTTASPARRTRCSTS